MMNDYMAYDDWKWRFWRFPSQGEVPWEVGRLLEVIVYNNIINCKVNFIRQTGRTVMEWGGFDLTKALMAVKYFLKGEGRI